MKRGGKNHWLLISSLRLGCFAPTKMLRKVKKRERNTSTVKRACGKKALSLFYQVSLSLTFSLWPFVLLFIAPSPERSKWMPQRRNIKGVEGGGDDGGCRRVCGREEFFWLRKKTLHWWTNVTQNSHYIEVPTSCYVTKLLHRRNMWHNMSQYQSFSKILTVRMYGPHAKFMSLCPTSYKILALLLLMKRIQSHTGLTSRSNSYISFHTNFTQSSKCNSAMI